MSTWLLKTKGVPGSAPGGYEWHDTDTPVEVHDDALAAELLEIPDAGFATVPAPEHDDAGRARVEVSEGGAKPADAPQAESAAADTPAPSAQEPVPEPGAQDKAAKPARKTAAAKTTAAKSQGE